MAAIASARAVPTALRHKRRRHALRVLGFMSPWIVGFAVFFAYPLISTFYFSFTNYNMLAAPHFVGARNYVYLFTSDPYVWKAIRNTGWLVAVMVPAQVLFALGVGMLLTRYKTGAGLLRTIFYLPSLAPPVAATVAFVFLFNPGTGPVNHVLRWLGITGPLWFDDPSWAKPALTILAVWGAGNLMVILLAALLDVPAELYEAASLDGARGVQRFWYVTLPTIAPVLLFAVVTSVIQVLQYFTQAMVASQVAQGNANITTSNLVLGYPNQSTLTFPAWLYTKGFQDFNMGYASTLSVLLFVVSLVFTALLLRRRGGFDAEGA